MSRKVFLSFLGGGAYRPCTYSREGLKFENEQFVQIATLKYLMSKEPWNENDTAYIFLTQGAYDANWVDEGVTLWDKKPKIGAVGLERRLKELNPPFSIHPIFGIKDGNDEDEILEIFSRVYDCISDGDLLYLDVTHGFRYLPMLMVVLGNYAKFLKKVEVKSITYGNFEYLGTEKPIVDLLPLVSIQDWTYAAGQYLECGNVDRLVSLGKSELIPILKATNGQDEDAKNLRSYLDRLKDVIEERRMCRGLEIINSKSFFQLKKLGNVVKPTVIPLMSPILSGIDKTFETFDESPNVKNGLFAAIWCYKNGLYQQSATLLEEFIVSVICERNSLPIDDRSMRELVNSAFMIKYTGLDESSWNEKCASKKDIMHALLMDELLCKKELLSLFDMVSKLRNDYNHAGMRTNPQPANSTNLKQRLYKQLLSAADIFDIEITNEVKALPAIFVNLSNHPSEKWDDDQLSEAKKFGPIIDIPFPAVDSSYNENQIEKLVNEYENIIHQKSDGHTPIVHIMGEMNLTYALVKRLRQQGIVCVASTTERVVEEHEGQKISIFKFVKFRRYE